MLSKVIFAAGLADALLVEDPDNKKLVLGIINDLDLDDSLLVAAADVSSQGPAAIT